MEACRAGETLLIFPEGTREKEGRLLPPKSGLFVIAAQAGVDVVPVRIRYDTPDGKMRLFCRVNVIYGAEVRTSPSPSVTPPLVGETRKQQRKLGSPIRGAAERMRG